MKIFIKGLNSCVMRKFELQLYRSFLIANGHEIVNSPLSSDAILLWTCGFRGDIRDNCIAEIKRYQKEFKAKLIVAGCLPDIEPELIRECFNGQVINWRDDKKKIEELFGCNKLRFQDLPYIFVEENLCDDVAKYRRENPDKDATFHDRFIKLLVSEGCNYKCSYCSERLAFPPYRSFPEDALFESCRSMVKKSACHRVILLSDSLGDYGSDIDTNLPRLMRRLKKIHHDLKFALNNLNPEGFLRFYEDMIEFLKNGDILHLNLPIQSASDKILRLMNRSYGRNDIFKVFGLLNEIGFKEFDTHIIIGFPGETEQGFQETIEFILKHKPKYVLASSFMDSQTMDAHKLPYKVDEATKKQRLSFAESCITAAGIICNTDDSELSSDRLRRLNIM